MAPKGRAKDDILGLLDLTDSKIRLPRVTRRQVCLAWKLLPQKERCLLALLHGRGASVRELAGLLGVSHVAVRRMARRAVQRATAPEHLAVLAAWRRLSAEERRLAYLHCFLGMPVRRVAALGLMRGGAATGGSKGQGEAAALRRMLRRVKRKARRWGQPERFQEGPDASPPGADSDSSAG